MSKDQYLAQQFPQAESLCYLNHAAVSPWPLCTQEAIERFAEENVHRGAQHYPRWMRVEQELRQRLAQLIGLSETDEIALAKSTSEALSIIAYGLQWQPGDEIIISNQEFPSNRIVWESLAQFGVEVKVANIDHEDPVSAIKALLSDRTRLVSISSVQYASGLKVDLESLGEICRAQKVLFCVDAIQSLGALTFDQTRIQADFIVADGHKWMMAAEGLALLYVKRKHIEALKLYQYGWHMVANRGDYGRQEWQAADDATRFECGSPNMLGIHALHASLGFLLEYGIDEIEGRLQERVGYLIEQLDQLPGVEILSPREASRRAGIVTFRPKGADCQALYRQLMEQEVVCAHRGGGIRFSPAFYTPTAVIDQAIERLRTLL